MDPPQPWERRKALAHWDRDRLSGPNREGATTTLRTKFLSKLRDLGAAEPVPLRLVFWDGEAFDFAPAPKVTLTLTSPSLMKHFLTGRFDRLGDAFAAGDLLVEGESDDILQTGITLAQRLGKFSRLAWLGRIVRPFRHSRRNDAAAIRSHYDVSDDFYRLWLDDRMIYSCAYFERGDEDIDEAQTLKLDHILRKLRLEPGQRLLDIGCGWGGLVQRAAREYGVRATGVTNSHAQSEFARQRIAAESLADRVEIRRLDYRDLDETETYDRIVSVGMYEHVGIANLKAYFDGVARLLKPGGALLNHGVIATDPSGKSQGPPGGEFIDRHVFPGGELPSLPHALRLVMQSGLEPVDIEDLRPHYARTLRLWRDRLEARADEAKAAAGDAQFRIWRIFLTGMAHAFDQGWLSVAQILAYKPAGGRPAQRPWSRAYQYVDGPVAPATSVRGNPRS